MTDPDPGTAANRCQTQSHPTRLNHSEQSFCFNSLFGQTATGGLYATRLRPILQWFPLLVLCMCPAMGRNTLYLRLGPEHDPNFPRGNYRNVARSPDTNTASSFQFTPGLPPRTRLWLRVASGRLRCGHDDTTLPLLSRGREGCSVVPPHLAPLFGFAQVRMGVNGNGLNGRVRRGPRPSPYRYRPTTNTRRLVKSNPRPSTLDRSGMRCSIQVRAPAKRGWRIGFLGSDYCPSEQSP